MNSKKLLLYTFFIFILFGALYFIGAPIVRETQYTQSDFEAIPEDEKKEAEVVLLHQK